MNSLTRKAIAAVTTLESWDIQAVLGGVNYLARQAAINTASRMLPAPPESGSGLEGFTAWEQAMKDPAVRKAVAPFVSVADEVTQVLNEYTDMPPSQYEEVLEFMLQRPPERVQFERDYNNRKKLGMRPQMRMVDFVDAEYAQALQRHAQLVATGETAVKLLNSIDPKQDADSSVTAPEWFEESLHAKVLQKLEQRWNRAEIRRTNPRISKNDRDIADANQRMIAKVIEDLGGTAPKFDPKESGEDEVEDFLIKAGKLPTA